MDIYITRKREDWCTTPFPAVNRRTLKNLLWKLCVTPELSSSTNTSRVDVPPESMCDSWLCFQAAVTQLHPTADETNRSRETFNHLLVVEDCRWYNYFCRFRANLEDPTAIGNLGPNLPALSAQYICYYWVCPGEREISSVRFGHGKTLVTWLWSWRFTKSIRWWAFRRRIGGSTQRVVFFWCPSRAHRPIKSYRQCSKMQGQLENEQGVHDEYSLRKS